VPIECFPGLTGLADELRRHGDALPDRWQLAREVTAGWMAGQQDLRGLLRRELAALPPAVAAQVADGSRETTTHFAWRLVDEPDAAFSFWLHEYKPQRDWWAGYANSVHNHRYHFCTTILRGGYLHERYEAKISPSTELISSAELLTATACPVGASAALLASDFHRIPRASDGTMTFLVKSRQVTPWSLSYDPETEESYRHVPVESRLSRLAGRL
jgi:hypothetical protein